MPFKPFSEEEIVNQLTEFYHTLLNPQAAESLMLDFDATINILEVQAESFGYCKSERLRMQGFHKIHFRRHRYLFVYRVMQDRVIIEGMYHELQDYEGSIG